MEIEPTLGVDHGVRFQSTGVCAEYKLPLYNPSKNSSPDSGKHLICANLTLSMPGDEFLKSPNAKFSSSIVNRSTSQLSLGLDALEMEVWEWTSSLRILEARKNRPQKMS
jgi:hypothetical protein